MQNGTKVKVVDKHSSGYNEIGTFIGMVPDIDGEEADRPYTVKFDDGTVRYYRSVDILPIVDNDTISEVYDKLKPHLDCDDSKIVLFDTMPTFESFISGESENADLYTATIMKSDRPVTEKNAVIKFLSSLPWWDASYNNRVFDDDSEFGVWMIPLPYSIVSELEEAGYYEQSKGGITLSVDY